VVSVNHISNMSEPHIVYWYQFNPTSRAVTEFSDTGSKDVILYSYISGASHLDESYTLDEEMKKMQTFIDGIESKQYREQSINYRVPNTFEFLEFLKTTESYQDAASEKEWKAVYKMELEIKELLLKYYSPRCKCQK
jgi:hypothetical protein